MRDNKRYLEQYENTQSRTLSEGLGGLVRRFADYKARCSGQETRDGMFIPRVLELCGLQKGSTLRVLDIGVGSGWALSYEDNNIEYIAVDDGENYKSTLEQRGIKFIKAKMPTRLTLDDQSIDLVIMNHLIEHIEDSQGLVEEIRRILRRGGFVYLRTPNISRVKWDSWSDYTHVKPYNVRGLTSMMEALGFKMVRLLYTDHTRMVIDIVTDNFIRGLISSRFVGGKEIEAVFQVESGEKG